MCLQEMEMHLQQMLKQIQHLLERLKPRRIGFLIFPPRVGARGQAYLRQRATTPPTIPSASNASVPGSGAEELPLRSWKERSTDVLVAEEPQVGATSLLSERKPLPVLAAPVCNQKIVVPSLVELAVPSLRRSQYVPAARFCVGIEKSSCAISKFAFAATKLPVLVMVIAPPLTVP